MPFFRCYPLFHAEVFSAAVKLDFSAGFNLVSQGVEGDFAVIE
jgi:hypothetical protein